jgi:trans-aconitate methyltransferase
MNAPLEGTYTVISMADVLEHLPDPRAALQRVRSLLAKDGALFVSCPNLDCASWRAMDAASSNPYWVELEHYHNFGRARLMALLAECGFSTVSYGVSQRYKACMELVALRHD